MHKFFSILKVQLLELFGINRLIHSKSRSDNAKFALALGFILLGTIFGFCISFLYNFSLASAMEASENGDYNLILVMMIIAISAFTFIMTSYKTNGTIFGYKNFDMVMSLPVKESTIVLSKVSYLYLSNLEFSIMAFLPALIVRFIFDSFSVNLLIGGIFLMLLVPLFPLFLAILVGTLITMFTSLFPRGKNIANALFTVLLFLFIFSFSFFSDAGSFENLSIIAKIYPLASWAIKGINENFLYYGLFVLVSVLPLAGLIFVLGKRYSRINSFVTHFRAKSNYSYKNQKSNSQMVCLIKKEGRRLLSFPMYLLNSFLSYFLMIFFAIMLVVVAKEASTQPEAKQIYDLICFGSIFLVAGVGSVSSSTSASISLEGKSLWIVKSLPIKPKTYYDSKLLLPILISLPFALATSLILIIGLQISSPLYIIIYMIVPFAFMSFSSIFGLLANIAFPNFSWTKEIVPVKQSLAVFVTMIMDGVVTAITLIILFLIGGVLGAFLCLLFVCALSILCYYLINTYGKKKIATF